MGDPSQPFDSSPEASHAADASAPFQPNIAPQQPQPRQAYDPPYSQPFIPAAQPPAPYQPYTPPPPPPPQYAQNPPVMQMNAPPAPPPWNSPYAVVGTGTFFWLQILFTLPVIGWIFTIIMSFAPRRHNIRHFARAHLILFIIGIVIMVGFYFLLAWVWSALVGSVQDLFDGIFGYGWYW